MQYRSLGNSGLKVSVLSFGAWQLGDSNYWGSHAQDQGAETVRVALDQGITLFETAEIYGNGTSERLLGQALGPDRKRVILATKVLPQNCIPDRLRAACEASLKRLGTDYIDLYQIHWPFRQKPVLDVQGRSLEIEPNVMEACEILRTLQGEGKIRYVGLSNFGGEDLNDWFFQGTAESNQIGYNIVSRAVEYDVLPATRSHQLGVLAYMPLLQGLLAVPWKTVDDIPVARRRTRHFSSHRDGVRHGEQGFEGQLLETVTRLREFSEAIGVPMATMCLCWVLAQPGVTSAIIGAREPKQLLHFPFR
ncbi:MAG: aldo/keto reductase [Candidatus Hydrogenedentes bacterium]|nr:aldo/keto reductase [Candidatus Hydrogenedentota bacterium]